MEIKNIKLSNLKPNALYLLSYPLKPEICHQVMSKFFPLPEIIINNENSIVFGFDNFHYFKSINQTSVDTLKMDLSPKEALLLNYNLKENFFGVNLYEKLIFIKKIHHYVNPKELQHKAELQISINPELLAKLNFLTGKEYKNVLTNGKISLKTALKICNFKKKQQKAWLELFENISFSNSHQLIIIEMIEEIMFRDKSTVREILEKVKIDRFLNQEKPQKNILKQIYQFRYPLYTKMEKEWLEKIKKLKLPDPIKIVHTPFFEKKEIRLKAIFRNLEEAKEILGRLKK